MRYRLELSVLVKPVDVLGTLTGDIFCSDLNGTPADEYSPEPVQHPQSWRCYELIRLHPNETSRHRDGRNYNQPNREHPTSRDGIQVSLYLRGHGVFFSLLSIRPGQGSDNDGLDPALLNTHFR